MKFALRPRLVVAMHDAVMAGASFMLALALRLGDWALIKQFVVPGTALFVAICVPVFVVMKLYRGLWRYASMQDLLTIVKAVTLSVTIFAAVMFFITRLNGIPRSALIINWLLLIGLLGGPRFAYRMLKDRILENVLRQDAHTVPLLLIGATPGADLFIRELQRSAHPMYRVVGIVDDDRQQKGGSLAGVHIYGTMGTLEKVVRRLEREGKRPQRIIVTGDLPPAQLQSLLEEADALGMTLGRLPRMSEFKEGLEERFAPRAIAIEDLLNRPQNTQGREEMRAFIAGKRIMVTGAGGSIGSELCRQIAACAPESIILLDRSEYALYTIDLELSDHFPYLAKHAVLGDICSSSLIDKLLQRHRPDIVFHAAAVKHVPLSEQNPLEAIGTNALGTRLLAQACQRHQVAAMVLISTDKAVHPSSLMGATKRLAERILQVQSEDYASDTQPTQFITVRFGNVLGSTGSVVPLFQQQIERSGPITVTHPDMVRFFMTIREAVELVIHSVILSAQDPAQSSALYVLDMGTPLRIVDLARQMIRLSGLKPDQDIKIVYSGLRPGEKLFEELFYEQEQVMATECKNILRTRGSFEPLAHFAALLNELEHYCQSQEQEAALAVLYELVPEFAGTPARQATILPFTKNRLTAHA